MAQMRVQRSFNVRLHGGGDWGPAQLDVARNEILALALEETEEGGFLIEGRIDGERFVAVISKEFPVERLEQITPRLVSTAEAEIAARFDHFAGQLGEAAWHLASEDDLASKDEDHETDLAWLLRQSVYRQSVYRQAGFKAHLAGGNARDVLGIGAMTAPSVCEVCVDVSSRVAAAVRDPEQLKSLVRSAVIDRSARFGGSLPAELGCEVDLVPPATVRVRGNVDDVREAVDAILGPPLRRSALGRVVDSWPPSAAPYWGGGTLACAAIAIALSWSLVVPWAILALVAGSVLAAGVVLMMGRRAGAYLPRILVGLSPAALVTGFAALYSVQMLGLHPGVNVPQRPAHMVDAFLLSFGVATTGGFLDLSPHSLTVRVEALVEMLLVVSLAGGSMFIAGRAVWRQLARSGGFDDQ